MPRTSKTEPSVENKFRAAGLSPAFAHRTSHSLILGDAREMHELTEPVHLVVTSPPYWTLKEYDGAAGDRQLGHLEDYAR
jgi:DNA modification methylase